MQARVQAGVTLVAFLTLRSGLLYSLRRRYSVRCPFKVGLQTHGVDPLNFATTGEVRCGFTWRRIQQAFLTKQFLEIREVLKRLRRPSLLGYYTRFFW